MGPAIQAVMKSVSTSMSMSPGQVHKCQGEIAACIFCELHRSSCIMQCKRTPLRGMQIGCCKRATYLRFGVSSRAPPMPSCERTATEIQCWHDSKQKNSEGERDVIIVADPYVRFTSSSLFLIVVCVVKQSSIELNRIVSGQTSEAANHFLASLVHG